MKTASRLSHLASREKVGKIKLVVFDLDGTLINAYPAVYRSVNFVMRRFGHPRVAHSLIKRTVGWGDRHLLRTFIGDRDLDAALRVYRRHHADALRQDTKLLPGALKVLRTLKGRGFKIAVASNRPTRFSLIAIRFLKVSKYFDHVLCGDKVKRAKPAPDILQGVLKKFRFRPGEALYVGDMGIDIQTGQRAGVATIAVATGSNTPQELRKLRPFKVVRKIDRILDVKSLKFKV